jgi:hypothetical protein
MVATSPGHSRKGIHMTDAGQMFSDGKIYERMMGRWPRL